MAFVYALKFNLIYVVDNHLDAAETLKWAGVRQNQQTDLYAHWRLRSSWTDAQAGLSLRWAHRSFCWCVMLWIKFLYFHSIGRTSTHHWRHWRYYADTDIWWLHYHRDNGKHALEFSLYFLSFIRTTFRINHFWWYHRNTYSINMI